MANLRPFFANFVSLLFILIHLGCFVVFPTSRHRSKNSRKPPSPFSLLSVSPPKLKPHKALHSSWSFVKRIFSSNPTSQINDQSSVFHQIPSPASSTRSISLIAPDNQQTTRPRSSVQSDFFYLRNGIHPCETCGEIFQRHSLLEQHESFRHAVSELSDDDPGKNIVNIIFITGWPGKNPMLHRVMRIHNSRKIRALFEEYRESVKSKAARQSGSRRTDERCIADGNELLRFHCTTFLCDLGQNGNSSICSHQYCNVCGIIGSGFSPKMDGISTLSTSWRGHVTIPEDVEEEFRFMNVKRAMLLCRVIAGRVGYDPGMGDKDDPGYDSLVGREYGGGQSRLDEKDELIVFNPRALLPCFVVAYTV